MNLQRDLLENYDQFKSKSHLKKYEVEDLYLKREQDLPLEMLEEIERA
jgi:hypothetical protein